MATSRSRQAGSTRRVPGLWSGSSYLRRDIKYPATDAEINSAPLVSHNRYGNVVGHNVYGGTESGKNTGEVKVKQHTRNKPRR